MNITNKLLLIIVVGTLLVGLTGGVFAGKAIFCSEPERSIDSTPTVVVPPSITGTAKARDTTQTVATLPPSSPARVTAPLHPLLPVVTEDARKYATIPFSDTLTVQPEALNAIPVPFSGLITATYSPGLDSFWVQQSFDTARVNLPILKEYTTTYAYSMPWLWLQFKAGTWNRQAAGGFELGVKHVSVGMDWHVDSKPYMYVGYTWEPF